MRGCAYLASHPCRRGSNKHMKLSFLFFVAVVFYICLSVQAAEEKPEVVDSIRNLSRRAGCEDRYAN